MMTKLSDLGPPIAGTRHGEPVNHEGDHFYFLPDLRPGIRRDLRQVIWHEQPGHIRLEFDS
jgi:hypothetical protein